MVKIMYLHVGAELYGSDKVLLQLVTGLDKTKYEPIVILPEDGPLHDELKRNNIKTLIVPYPILRRKYFNPSGLFHYVSLFIKQTKELAKIARREQVDLIHTNTVAVFEGAYLRKLINKPNIWHVHEIILNPKFMDQLISFMVGRFSDKIVAISKATRDHLTKSMFVEPDKIDLIYNGISLTNLDEEHNLRTELSIPQNHLVFGHVGRINAWKGQQDFLSAAIPLMEKNNQIELILSGDAYQGQEWREEELHNFVKQYPQLEERIHFLGYRNDVERVFNTMDVFVTCSTKPEPFSMVTIEAMAHHKPVVAYDAAGPGEIVKDKVTGLLVTANDVEALSEGLKYFVDNPNEISKQGMKSYERVKTVFSNKQFINDFQRAYDQLTK